MPRVIATTKKREKVFFSFFKTKIIQKSITFTPSIRTLQKKDCASLFAESFPTIPKKQLEDSWSTRS